MKNAAYRWIFALAFLCFATPSQAKNLQQFGPQIRVAVAQFGATDRFAATYGGWNIGGGLSAQLVTALIDSDRVVVVERAVLSKVLMEQELGEAQLSSPLTQVQAGHLLGVDYLIVGQVTEFEERQMAGGAALAVLKGIGPKASTDMAAAHVGIDMRVIDTRTGEILHSHRAQGKAWGKTFGLKLKSGVIDFGGELFHKTPLGKASRRAIRNALAFILEVVERQTKEFTWLARVIEVADDHIYIDAGRSSNVMPGEKLRIIDVERVLTDPETNEILGLVEKEVGLAEAVTVERKYTKARLLDPVRPSVGSLVRFANENKPTALAQRKSNRVGYQIME